MQPLPPPSAGQSGVLRQNRPFPGPSSNTNDSLLSQGQNQPSGEAGASSIPPKKRKHRGGKRRKNRRQSFAAPPSEASGIESSTMGPRPDNAEDSDIPESPLRPGESFYRRRNNRSNDSLDSDVLLDHRHQQGAMRPRRESRLNVSASLSHHRSSTSGLARQNSGRSMQATRQQAQDHEASRGRPSPSMHNIIEPDDDFADDRTPLISVPFGHHSPTRTGYGIFKPTTRGSSASSGRKKANRSSGGRSFPKWGDDGDYDVNNPPSVPGSPHLPHIDPMLGDSDFLPRSPTNGRTLKGQHRDTLINIDGDDDEQPNSAPPSPRLRPDGLPRRALTFPGEDDVCFPTEDLSELAEEDFERSRSRDEAPSHRRRRKKREWPLLWVLDEWSREEKEDQEAHAARSTQIIREPVMIDGRLRPSRHSAWHRPIEDAPYRYTYFNEEFENTIHAQSIGGLVQAGATFRELFIPDPPLLEESSSESDTEPEQDAPEKKENGGLLSPKAINNGDLNANPVNRIKNAHSRSASRDTQRSQPASGERTPQKPPSVHRTEKPKRYGERPVFWLDVTCPTEQEMRVLGKAFGIHALTIEDILQQEAREKVELFKNYYFVNYRTFEQDTSSDDYLEPINMYMCVFRWGVLSFHTSQIPHPANVRRRIRSLRDYVTLSADWISYGVIDDITDAYQPLINNIEREVDIVDDEVLLIAASGDQNKSKSDSLNEKNAETRSIASTSSSSSEKGSPGIDMLRRVGEVRKKVMSLYRLLGNKADVIKVFAKRCNEDYAVAPKTEIGLYLGDIQDHILTMTSNLSHYETLLSRAHSNYLAQVSIRMTERSEQTGDILNKLTVLGTIVLPMNIICGMWGMNVQVPGQDIENLNWFWGITAGLILFAVVSFMYCKISLRIV